MIWMVIIKGIEECNPNKKRKLLNIFDEKPNPIVTGLFIRGRKRNISLCFYYTILSRCAKKYYTKFHSLFYENSKKGNFNKLRIYHQILTLKTSRTFVKNVLQFIFFFSYCV